MKKLQIGAIYVGGFVGPFTGQALAVVLPEFAETFDITVAQAALTISAYLFPFATMMLFSGRLVRKIPPHKVILTAYAVTLPFALALLITPSWFFFLLCFAVIGIANAFTTPVFQMMLRELTPPESLGSALGTYAAMQSLGMLSAPLISGLSTLVSWRLAFLATILTSAFILLVRVPVVPSPDSSPQRVTGQIQWGPVGVQMFSSFVVGIGVMGLGFLAALYVGDEFGLGPVGRGLVIMCGGTAAFLTARPIGGLADRYGTRAILVSAALVAAVALFLFPLATWVWLLILAWALTIMAGQGIQATVNLAVIGGPGGSSLISTVQAFRFFGTAAAPVVFLPIYTGIGGPVFWVPAAALLVVAVLQQLNPGNRRND
ncbi:Major Facilitator Superfamily protein [Corynebacterium occultum]|uniref:Major Facilitator Superfamily protein n=1 Tax=Corynebacterium occultum TaxID=2675219 RepID=A0A6B8W6A8_9CORY|nr:MFS transporter [Corynebacterium occultum]QGU06845.1 Major Facilitator Superfamily protein [Corynebacterium occultum]